MKLVSFFILLFAGLNAFAAEESREVDLYYPVITLNNALRIEHQDSTVVQDNGLIHFRVFVPDFGEEFFSRHHLHINIPYYSKGSRKNHYQEVTGAGLVTVSIPSEQPVGTPIYFYDGVRKPVKSVAERVFTPVVHFFLVYEMLNVIGKISDVAPYQPSIDFKNGAFFEGIEGYALLDSSLRFANDGSEYLEIFYQMNPDGSSATVVLLFVTGAVLMKNVPIDTTRFTALGMQHSFIYSGLAGKSLDTVDHWLITPKFSENLFPSNSSVRSFKSKLASQTVRGPLLSLGLAGLDKLPEHDHIVPGKWLYTKKLMMKTTSEHMVFNKMLGQKVGGAPGAMLEWGLHGASAAISEVGGQPGVLQQTFSDQFEQKMGARASEQITDFKYKVLMKDLMKDQPSWLETINSILQDFAIGGLVYIASSKAEIRMGGQGLISNRIGKGAGMWYSFKDLGGCIVESGCGHTSDFIYERLRSWFPSLAPYFRRDYMVEIDHGLTKPEPAAKSSGKRSSDIRDEL